MSTEDTNRGEGAVEKRHGPRVLSWDDFTAYLDHLEKTYRNFTLIVRKRESEDVEVRTKWRGLRKDAVVKPSPLRK